MVTLACVISDADLAERIASVMKSESDAHTLVVGTDSTTVSRLAASRRIDALCFLPMSPAELLRVRQIFVKSHAEETPVRTALLVQHSDAALVYHALGYGIDDVVTLSESDEGLRADLTTFATGSARVCEPLIAAAVPVPHPIIQGVIDYADAVDRQIVTLVSIGYADREIAEILHYSNQVIRNRVSHIMLRSGIRNRTQLSARHTFEAIESGFRGRPFFTAWTP